MTEIDLIIHKRNIEAELMEFAKRLTSRLDDERPSTEDGVSTVFTEEVGRSSAWLLDYMIKVIRAERKKS